MRLLKQAMAVLGTVIAIAVLVAVLAPQSARAVVAALVQIVPGTTTHLGQNESQLVALFCGVNSTACFSMDSSGSIALTNYVVPAGYTLVITDYEWTLFGASGQARACDTIDVIVGVSTRPLLPVGSCTITTAGGEAYRAEHFTSGIRVASGVPIRDSDAAAGIGSADIQGYLVPN
ncbi:MAG: hypothetical protein WBD73_09220 [Candidatus Acidiferrales bacterium]